MATVREEGAMRITVYKVLSFLVEGGRRPRLHGVRSLWNDPTDHQQHGKRGAIQLAGRIRDQFYKKKIDAYVYIEETKAIVSVRSLKIRKNKKAALG